MPSDPQQLKLIKEIGRKEILLSIARDLRSGRLFVGASDGKIYVGDVRAEGSQPEFSSWEGHSSYVTGLALAGTTLVSGSYDGSLIWWDADSGQQQRRVEAHARWIRRLAASPDGRRVASVADDMVVRVWDVTSGQIVHELRGHEPITPQHFPSMLYACGYSADGELLATADRLGHVVIWNMTTGQQVAALEAPDMYTWDQKQRIHSIGGARSVAFSPDGKSLAVGGMGQVGNIDHLEGKTRVEVFDWRKQERTHEFVSDSFKGLVERLIFHPAGEWLLGAGGDNGGHLQFFDLSGNKLIRQEKAPTHLHDLTMDETAETLFAAAHGKLLVWSLTA